MQAAWDKLESQAAALPLALAANAAENYGYEL